MEGEAVQAGGAGELPGRSVEELSASPQLFDNPLLDKLSRLHWFMPLFLYMPLLALLAWLSFTMLRSAPIGISVLCGYLAWTLTEYFGHRYFFHIEFPGRLGARIHFLIHRVHHEHPNDPLCLVMPPLLSAPIMAIAFVVIFAIDGGRPSVYPALIGFVSGYLIYDMVHYAVHHVEPKTRLGRKLRRLHMLHHFHDAERGFGISAPWWDKVFGTAQHDHCAWSNVAVAKLPAHAKPIGRQHAPIPDVSTDSALDRRPTARPVKSIEKHFAAVVRLAKDTSPPVDAVLIQTAPLVSFVVCIRDASAIRLNELLDSFHEQPRGAAELILCDGGSTATETLARLSRHSDAGDVRMVRDGTNGGIASAMNAGVAAARGKWIGFIDRDDALTPGVVQLIAKTAREHTNCKLIYTDEVLTDGKLKPVEYLCKPAYDEVLLSGCNYIGHLACYRRERLRALGGFRNGFDGSEDYDLLLRYVRGLRPEEIKHLPFPGYRCRSRRRALSAQFVNLAIANARNSLAELFACGAEAVEPAITKELHRVRLDKLVQVWPRVSIIIPNRNSYALISRLLSGLTTRTDYPDFEIIVIDNGTTDDRVLELYAKASETVIPFRYEIEPAPFNFSRQTNRGIAVASGELILLLNNDVEIIEQNWLREMVSCFSYPDVGIVGARLLYPNGRIQHVGVIIGLKGLCNHWFIGQPASSSGPMARLHVRQSLTAVTGACMLISRKCIETVGAFEEYEFPVTYNDIDFCLRAVANGYRVVWTPFATLRHRQQASRGSDLAPWNLARSRREIESMRRRHNPAWMDDRAFSPWYSRNRIVPTIMMLGQLPKAR